MIIVLRTDMLGSKTENLRFSTTITERFTERRGMDHGGASITPVLIYIVSALGSTRVDRPR